MEQLKEHPTKVLDFDIYSNTQEEYLIHKFIEYMKEYGSESYQGALLPEFMIFLDITFFNQKLFSISGHNIEEFKKNIELLLSDNHNKKWKTFKTLGHGAIQAIFGKKNYLKFLDSYIIDEQLLSKPSVHDIKKQVINQKEHKPHINNQNKIYYGSPGTGKSHKVKEDTKGLPTEQVERITFHPEYDYASFVGGYKPTMNGDDIRYEFVPQAFTNIYVKAWQNLDKPYYLIIEEINRGNCAEIFGDIFQLLDRDSDYSVTPSQELQEYLAKELPTNCDTLQLPPNLSILATMNTSDQSLYPMDSAFKRRWDWEYIPINYEKTYIDSNGEEKENISASFKVQLSETESFSWLKFILAVNTNIKSDPNLGMDKCLGNYFIKPKNGNVIELKTFINKAIFYLWNDVFKDEPDYSIFTENASYEEFFPINSNGQEQMRKILNSLAVTITTETDTTDQNDSGE